MEGWERIRKDKGEEGYGGIRERMRYFLSSIEKNLLIPQLYSPSAYLAGILGFCCFGGLAASRGALSGLSWPLLAAGAVFGGPLSLLHSTQNLGQVLYSIATCNMASKLCIARGHTWWEVRLAFFSCPCHLSPCSWSASVLDPPLSAPSSQRPLSPPAVNTTQLS